jgi:hypothetical protein
MTKATKDRYIGGLALLTATAFILCVVSLAVLGTVELWEAVL